MSGQNNSNMELKAMGVRIEENANEIEEVQDELKDKLDKNGVLIAIEESIDQKKLITEEEIKYQIKELESQFDAKIKNFQLQIIKWTVGIGLSAIGVTIGALRLFL